MTTTKNWNCDGDKCREPHGEVRKYPLGGGANLILCRACWANENNYRHDRNLETGSNQPLENWYEREVYGEDAENLAAEAKDKAERRKQAAALRNHGLRRVNLMDALARSIDSDGPLDHDDK